MNSRLVFDRFNSSRTLQGKSLLSHGTRQVPAPRFICTRVGVMNPPLSPVAKAFTVTLRNVAHRLAGLLSGAPKGGVQ
jgi:hypothetical protein